MPPLEPDRPAGLIGAGGMVGSLVAFWWALVAIDRGDGELGSVLAAQGAVAVFLALCAVAVRRIRLFALGAVLGMVIGLVLAVLVAVTLVGAA